MIPVTFPDVQLSLIEHLRAHFPGIPVVGETPKPRPAQCVVIRSDGGTGLGDVRAEARLGVRVWAETRAECADLAAVVVEKIGLWPTGGPICSVTFGIPIPVADASGQPETYLPIAVLVIGA